MKFFSYGMAFAATGLLVSGAAVAEQPATPNYNYVELAYSTGDVDIDTTAEDQPGGVDFGSLDTDGYKLVASGTLFEEQLWLYGSFTSLEDDENFTDYDLDQIQLGVGTTFSDGGPYAFDISVRYRSDDPDLDAFKDDDFTGLGFLFGGRYAFFDWLELGARIGVYGGDYDASPYYEAFAVSNIGDLFAVSLGWEQINIDDDTANIDIEVSQITLGVRARF